MNNPGNLATLLGDLYGAIEHRIVAGWHYRKVRTFQDLLDLQAADILADRDYEEDPTRWDLLTTHLEVLRAGVFVTAVCGAGRNDEEALEFRAAMTGLADEETKDWLDDLLYRVGRPYPLHVFELYDPKRPETGGIDGKPARGVAVTRTAGGTVTNKVGWQQSAREILGTYPVRRSLRSELTGLWQITIYDPQWANDSDLPYFLADAAKLRQHTLAEK